MVLYSYFLAYRLKLRYIIEIKNRLGGYNAKFGTNITKYKLLGVGFTYVDTSYRLPHIFNF